MTFGSARPTACLRAALLLFYLTSRANLVAQEPSAPAPLNAPQREALQAEAKRLWEEAQRLYKVGQVGEAIAAGQKMLANDRQLLGNAHQDIAFDLDWLAARYVQQENFAAAQQARAEALEIRIQLLGKDHWQVTNARLALAHVEGLARLSRDERKSLAVADELTLQSLQLYRQEKYREAIMPAEKALAIRRQILGSEHSDTALCLNNLAQFHRELGEYRQAEPLLVEALAAMQQTLGKDHPDTASGFDNLGGLYKTLGKYTAAESHHLDGLAIRKRVLGPGHPDVALSLNNLAVLYLATGDFPRGVEHCRAALKIKLKAYGPDHPETALTQSDLGLLALRMGDHAQAEQLYRQALAALTESRGKDHPETAIALTNLGGLYLDKGDYVRSEPPYRRALEIHQRALGPGHERTAVSLNNLASLYQAMGDFAKAEPLYLRSLEIRRAALGDDHPAVAGALSNLALFYEQTDELGNAAPLYRRALEIDKLTLAANHPDHALRLGNLAILLSRMGESAEAESLYQQALEIRTEVLGRRHAETASTLNNLAGHYFNAGDYAQAAPLLRRAIEARADALGEKHPLTAQSLNNLGMVLQAQGQFSQAEPYGRLALETALGNLELASAIQSERQQLAMARAARFYLDNYLILCTRASEFQETAYERLLAWKGSVLLRQRALRVVRQQPELRPALTELQSVTAQLAQLALATPEPPQREVWRERINRLSQQKELLEGDLATRSHTFRDARRIPKLADLRAALPEDVVLIDFLESGALLSENDKSPQVEPRLLAFVVRQAGPVRLVILDEPTVIEQQIDAWRAGFGHSREAQDAGQWLRDHVWKPLETHLGGAKVVLLSPDGALGKLAFAALPGREPGTFLLEDWSLAVIPAPASLVADDSPQHAVIEPSLLLLGQVDYEYQPVATNQPSSQEQSAVAPRSDKALRFAPLVATTLEMKSVGESFERRFHGKTVTPLAERAAQESSFREIAPRHSVLHLATHGFFAPSSILSALARKVSDHPALEASSERQSLAGYHPGLLSGLAFAGANRPDPQGDDGILTAEEVGSLDLSRCDLAVLSACETGLGKASGGEGLLGLQRAFQVAGAESVVASLWKVPDDSTRLLMERFYDNLWNKTQEDGKPYSKLEALREAQLWMLRQGSDREEVRRDAATRGLERVDEPNLAGKRLSPYFWAAFVLSGDWR